MTGIVILSLLGACKNRHEEVGVIPPPRLPDAAAIEQQGEGEEAGGEPEITVGDRLEIFVKEDPKYHRTFYFVREHGDIIIPQVGRIHVAGLSVTEAQQTVKARLEQGQLLKATVILDRLIGWWVPRNYDEGNWGSYGTRGLRSDIPDDGRGGVGANGQGQITVFITGKVAHPGEHQFDLPKNQRFGVYEAILKSGGIGRFGDAKKVYVMRADETGRRVKIKVNVKRIIKGEIEDLPIGDGDLIVVPEKVFGF